MNQDLLEKMRTYPDVRIMNTIKQSSHFDSEVVDIAKFIAEEKGLTSPEKIKMMEKTEALKKIAILRINEGWEPQKIKDYLLGEGLDEQLSNEVLTDAAKSVTIQEEEKKSEGGTSIWFIVFIVFFVIRMIIRFARE